MNEISENNSLQAEPEITSPPSLKRPRTHCTVTNDHNRETRFDLSEVLAFWKTTNVPSPISTMKNNLFLLCTTEKVDIQNEKPYEKMRDTKLFINPITKVTISGSDNTDTLSSSIYVTAERHLIRLGKGEQPPVTESDKLCSYLPDEVKEALVDSHTSKDTSSDMSSHPDCEWLRKSLEDEALVGCCLFTGNDKEGRQVQHTISQIQAFALSSSDEEVRCQSDSSHKNVLLDTWSQYDEVEVSSQKLDEHKFSENIFFSEEEKEGNIPVSSSHCAHCKLNYSKPEEELTGNIGENVKNEKILLHVQICENEDTVCDGETKGPVNENGVSKNTNLSVAECAEGSMVPYDVARNTTTENVSLDIDDLCGVKGEHPAGKMIARAWNEMADHTTEAPISAKISQEPAEGDNSAGLFSVIDPAIWSETDREVEEKHCKPESSAGVELSPSIKVCEMEIPPPFCFDVRPSQEPSVPHQIRQFNHQRAAHQCKDEKKDSCQSCTEPQACSITSNEARNATSCQCSSPCTPAKLPPAEDEYQESHSTVGLQLKKQDQSDLFPISHDYLRTQVAEQSLAEISRMDVSTMVKERHDMTSSEEIKTDELVTLQKLAESEEELLHRNGLHKEDTACDSISDWIEGDICECNDGSPCVKEVKFECFSDHSYSADMSMMLETTVGKERKEVTDVGEEMNSDEHENSEMGGKSEADLQQQNRCTTDTMEVPLMECMCEQTEGNMSASGNKLALVGQHRQGNMLSSCTDYLLRAETCMAENTDDHVASISPPTSDAVVPCQNDLSHSQNVSTATTLNRSGRFSPGPNAFTLHHRVPGGMDTFEKIHLSPDHDGEDDAFLTSLPEQLIKTPQKHLSNSLAGAESDRYDQAQEEEEEEEAEKECHTEHVANGFLNSDTSCKDLQNFVSATNVIAPKWPEQQPKCDLTCDSCEPIQADLHTPSKSSTASSGIESTASDVDQFPEFEMKKQFDIVLKELNLFFDVSIRDFASDSATSPEQCHDIAEPLEADSSDCKEHVSSLEEGHHRNTLTDDADDVSLAMCRGDPVMSFTAGSGDGEQEVPLGSHMCPETCLRDREPRETEQRRKMCSPSFTCLPLLEQLSFRPPVQHKRLEPLRTCARPIRVGLSKRAKTKQLHRPHPYK